MKKLLNYKAVGAIVCLALSTLSANAQISAFELSTLRSYFVALGNVVGTDLQPGSVSPSKLDRAYLELSEAESLYATKQFVFDQDYVTLNYLDSQNYATQSYVQDQDYATKNYVESRGYATESFVTSQDYATEDFVLNTVGGIVGDETIATETFVTSQGYATETFVTEQGYITPDDLPTFTGITVTFTLTISSVDHVFEFENGLLKALTIDGVPQP